jgi:DNA-binding transcriptional LysR family regulator
MRVETLREYVTFARCLNFTRAAAELHLTQSTLSKHVAALERELGATLVLREKPLRLSAAGIKLLETAQAILAVYDDEMASWRAACHDQPVQLLWFDASDRLARLLGQVTDVPYDFVLSTGDEGYFSELIRGRADIVLVVDVSLVPELSQKARALGLEVMGAGSRPGMLLVQRGHPLARKEGLSRADLKNQEILIVGRGPFDELRQCISKFLGDDLDLRFKLKSIDGNFRNLDHLDFGDSIFFMSRDIAKRAMDRRDDLVGFDAIDGEPVDIPIAFIYRRDDPNPNVARLVESLLERGSHSAEVLEEGLHPRDMPDSRSM